MKLKMFAAAALALALGACAGGNDDAASGGSAKSAAGADAGRQVATAPQFKPGSQEELNATIGDRVFFDFDKYDLKPEARATVGSWADWMKRHQNVSVQVEGHADERGTREYNLALGARRANAIRDYLGALGVTPNRVNTISYGKERPAVLGSNNEAWAQNRRGVVVVE